MANDDKLMTFGEHLLELRRRVITCVAVTALLFILIYLLFGTTLLDVLRQPAMKYFPDFRLRTLTPFEVVIVMMKVSLIAALGLASPIILYQVWAFVTPALKSNELRWVKPILGFGALLFAAGVLLCYFLIVPAVYTFFLRMNITAGTEAAWSLDSFIDTELIMLGGFGLAFELPLVVMFLTQIGIVRPQTLARQRKYALLIIVIVSAILTPDPSAVTMLMMAIPLYLLYEFSIFIARIFSRRRERRLAG